MYNINLKNSIVDINRHVDRIHRYTWLLPEAPGARALCGVEAAAEGR